MKSHSAYIIHFLNLVLCKNLVAFITILMHISVTVTNVKLS